MDATAPPALDAAAVRRVWPEVLAATKQHSRSIEAMLVNATVRTVDGDTLVLGIGAPSLARRLSEARNADVVTKALHAVLGVRWQLRCESATDAPAPARPQPRRPEQPRRPARRAAGPGGSGHDGEPLPPEPPPENAPPDTDEESMIAEAASDAQGAPAPRRDPEEVAIELLSAQLGARTLDRG